MRPYEALAKQIHDSAYTDMSGGTRTAEGVLQAATAALPGLAQRGDLTPGDVLQIDMLLKAPGPPPLDVRDWVSELNLAGAQALGDLDLIRQAALTRCAILLAIAQAIDHRQGRRVLRRVTGLALDLARQWHLEELDPNVVGDLHLQAGNVYMGNVGPVNSEVDRGLEHFLAGYRLKQGRADPGELARLAELMRRAASFLLSQSSLTSVLNVDLSRAHQQLETVVEVFEAIGPPAGLREARMQLLAFYLAYRFLEAAEPLLELLLAGTNDMPPGPALLLALYRADWLSQRHRAAEALEVLDPLFAANALPDNHWPYAQNIRANCYRLLNRLDEAYAAFQALLQHAEQAAAANPGSLEPINRRILAQTHLGYLDIRRGRQEEGRAWFEQAAQLITAHVGTWELQVRHADMWALALYEVGAWEAALEQYERARALRQRIEAELLEDVRLREGFMGSWAQVDARIIELCWRTGRPARALEVAEGSKSRVLQELARRHSPLGAVDEAPARVQMLQVTGGRDREVLLRDYALLATERARLDGQLSALRPDAIGRWRVEQRLASVERQLAGLRALIERRALERVTVRPVADLAPLSAEEVVRVLPVGERDGERWGIVSFHSSGEGTAALVAAPGETAYLIWQADWTYERLLHEIYEPWDAVRRGSSGDPVQATEADWPAALERCRRQLYAALWAPIAPEIARRGLRHLLILPHRLLHLLPWAALHDEAFGRDLLDTVGSVCVAPSAAFVRAAAEELPALDGSGQPAVFGVPDLAAALMGLEAAEVAAQYAVARGAQVTPALGAHAHPGALYQVGPQAGLLHLACHGEWDPDDLGLSGLRMAPLPPNVPPLFGQADGLVNLPALLTQLSLPRCALAVLSACESGLARRTTADEPLSLPLAFLLAGARQVVASLWRVRDDSTLLLMGEFYRRYLGGQPAAASLAGAQRWLRDLGPEAAIAALEASRHDLSTYPLPGLIGKRAEVQMARQINALQKLPPGERPYAAADHWAAFVCFGLRSA